MLVAAPIACGFTLGDSENTANAQGNTHSAQVKRTPRRDLKIHALNNAVSAKRDDSSAALRVTSGIARSADENGHVISTQRAFISDDMDVISLDELAVSAAELSISDDMDVISLDELTVSAAELSISDDMDIISLDELTISDDMDIISLDELTISAAELSISDDMDIISID